MEQKHDIYWQMYCDIWEYHKKYINNLQDNNEFWKQLVDEGRAIAKKHGQNKFITNLVLGEINEFERKDKEQKGQQE